MSKTLFLALVAISFFTGCYKRDESHLNEACTSGCAVFNIRVGTGDNSAIPVSGVYVDLVWEGPKEEIFGGPVIDVAKGYTGAHGIVTFNIKPIGNEFSQGSFLVNVSRTADYFPAHKTLYDVRKADTVLNTTVHMPSVAYLRVVYKNFDPKTTDDSFDAGPYYKTPDYWEGLSLTSPDMANYPGSYFGGNQKPFDSLIYTGLTAGNQYTYFKVLIKRNGVRIDHLDSLYIPKGTVGTYRVDYQHSFQ